MGGDVPDGWRIKLLGNLVAPSDVRRGNLSPEPVVLSCSKDLGLVRQSVLFGRRLASDDTRRYKLVLPGDFVYDPNLLWTGSIARNALGVRGIVSPVYEVFRATDGCDPEYLRHWLKRPARIKDFAAISEGTNVRRRRATFDDFAGLRIKLPSLAEQRRIAQLLDALDEAIKKTEAVIAATEELRKALLQDLLTRGVPGWHTEWKTVPDIGTIPACWEVVRLGQVLGETQYGTSASLNDSPDGIPVLRMGNLRNGSIDWKRLKYTSCGQAAIADLMLQEDDILFNRTNSIDLVGKVSLVTHLPMASSFASYLVRLKVDRSLADAHWLNAYLNMDRVQESLRRMATRGVSQANINPSNLKKLTVPRPEITEQKAMSQVVGCIEESERRERALHAQLRKVKSECADALLSGRVRMPLHEEVDQ